jgi:MFS family permease
VLASAPLRTVLIVWNVVLVGSAAINVAEVVFAKETLDAGDVGFGVLIAASGVGLALGAYLAAPTLGLVGLRRHYVGSIVLMGIGWGGAAFAGTIWVAVPLVVAGAVGNGAAIVCNQILVQRGAPDRYRGRALATIMSSNYAVLGLAMAGAGLVTATLGADVVWMISGAVYLFGAAVCLVVTRWLPVSVTDEDDVLDRHGEEAASALLDDVSPEPVYVPEPVVSPAAASVPDPVPEFPPAPAYTGQPVALGSGESSSRGSLDRIATLLEEIEQRRRFEAGRRAS